ncbi:MAG: phosphatase PAP2 family protein [Casimicrobiaceae bacterium]
MNDSAAGGWLSSLRSRCSPTGWFFIHMGTGALVFALAGWVFGGLAEDVISGDPITVIDAQLATWLHAHLIGPLTEFMLVVSLVHGLVGISVMTTIFAGYLWWRRDHYWLLALILTVPGGMLVNVAAKYAFHRQRPSFADPIVTLTTYSFPSGHTLAAMVFYGTLAAYLMTVVASNGRRMMILSIAGFLIVLVGVSRIYLGAHFMSDVLAALAEGIGWVALCLMATSTLERGKALQRTTSR